MGGGVQRAMACGADVRLGGELSETRSPLREVGLDVRSVLHPGLHNHLPEGAFEMTSGYHELLTSI